MPTTTSSAAEPTQATSITNEDGSITVAGLGTSAPANPANTATPDDIIGLTEAKELNESSTSSESSSSAAENPEVVALVEKANVLEASSSSAEEVLDYTDKVEESSSSSASAKDYEQIIKDKIAAMEQSIKDAPTMKHREEAEKVQAILQSILDHGA